jgi:hypothetical protein
VIAKPMARTTYGSLREGGIQRRMHIAKEGIRSRGEEQRKRIERDMKDQEREVNLWLVY